MLPTIARDGDAVVMIDQRKLPAQEVYVHCKTAPEVARAIKTMVIRGAPAIGVAAALGLSLAARNSKATGTQKLAAEFLKACETMAATRPTAVNLFWAIQRMRRVFTRNQHRSPDTLRTLLEREALAMHDEDIAVNRDMGRHGAELIEDGATVMTHCNAGALATAGYGTALGVIRAAVEAGKRIQVIACETRPFLQGARLTAWELKKDRIPVTLITDNMAGHLMARGRIGCIIVGTDRTAANGDVANKIGTLGVAILARHFGVPFYVAAPTSTIDPSIATGKDIPIEQRDAREVSQGMGATTAPPGVEILNPAFDVTPAELVGAIITEHGVARPPYARSLAEMCRRG
jgi:methylthioribose-1-phosphate isomerase